MPLSWCWHRARLVSGHGVASGRNPASPYPAGTIALQAPHFRRYGLDLSGYFPGTLNLDFSPAEWRLQMADLQVPALSWSDRHPPETFSFWRCRLRLTRVRAGAAPGDPEVDRADALAEVDALDEVEGLIYHPHPETKHRHHQPAAVLEVLAPPLAALAEADPAAREDLGIQLGVDPRRCRLILPERLRAQLLELLKFRVLAAQEGFFETAAAAQAPPGAAAASGAATPSADAIDLGWFRRWLAQAWPPALDLADGDLRRCLADAHRLYVD
jgi:hypothetical protein